MKITLSSILKRFKKYMLVFLLLPFLTAGFSYIFHSTFEEEVSEEMYYANATLYLGNFNDARLTTPDKVKSFVESTSFLEKVKASNSQDELLNLNMNLIVQPVSDDLVRFQYSGTDSGLVEKTLSDVVNQFLDESDKRYKQWTSLVNQNIDELRGTEVIAEESALKQQFLYDLDSTIFNARSTQISEPVALLESETTEQPRSLLFQAAFGFIIGIMISSLLLIFPELFKD
ncbi:hypothetical protein ACNRWW_18910 [Metabacillus sp. HB246100]